MILLMKFKMDFKLITNFTPTGDQPTAIESS